MYFCVYFPTACNEKGVNEKHSHTHTHTHTHTQTGKERNNQTDDDIEKRVFPPLVRAFASSSTFYLSSSFFHLRLTPLHGKHSLMPYHFYSCTHTHTHTHTHMEAHSLFFTALSPLRSPKLAAQGARPWERKDSIHTQSLTKAV
jgi:hypothetical protein